MSNEFQDYYDGIIEKITKSVGSESYARNLGKNNYFRIKSFISAIKSYISEG